MTSEDENILSSSVTKNISVKKIFKVGKLSERSSASGNGCAADNVPIKTGRPLVQNCSCKLCLLCKSRTCHPSDIKRNWKKIINAEK